MAGNYCLGGSPCAGKSTVDGDRTVDEAADAVAARFGWAGG